MSEYLTNLVHAKPHVYALVCAAVVVEEMYHTFSKQPQFQHYVAAHWVAATLIASVKGITPILALFYPTLKRAA